MLGHAGYLTSLPPKVLDDMIEAVKGVEPSTGYPPILALSEMEAEMRKQRVKRTKTVCTYCGVGCTFDIWTRDRHILKVEPTHGPANGISTCVKGKFAWDFVNSPDRLRKPLKRRGQTRLWRLSGTKRSQIVRGQLHEDQEGAWAGCAGVYRLLEVHERRKLPDAEAGARGDRHQQRR